MIGITDRSPGDCRANGVPRGTGGALGLVHQALDGGLAPVLSGGAQPPIYQWK